ncbi:hypothetical protein H1Q59_07385 [Holosporaceae bacterium 'Namur']|nr:hypothetical protein [Holosporaceae bacterium 'Namur']
MKSQLILNNQYLDDKGLEIKLDELKKENASILASTTHLDLSGNMLNNLDFLQDFSNVKILNLNGNEFTNDSNLKILGNLKNLTKIYFRYHEEISEFSFLEEIITNLKILDLTSTRFSDKDLPKLKKATSLRELYLMCTDLTKVDGLDNLRNLTTISITGTKVIDLKPLAELPKLHTIYMTDIEDLQASSLRVLEASKSLRKIQVDNEFGYIAQDIEYIVKAKSPKDFIDTEVGSRYILQKTAGYNSKAIIKLDSQNEIFEKSIRSQLHKVIEELFNSDYSEELRKHINSIDMDISHDKGWHGLLFYSIKATIEEYDKNENSYAEYESGELVEEIYNIIILRLAKENLTDLDKAKKLCKDIMECKFNLSQDIKAQEEVIINNIENIISEHKHKLLKLPNYQNSKEKEFQHLKEFFYCLDRLGIIKEVDEAAKKLKDKYIYHFEKVWSHLLEEFLFPGWLYDDNGFHQSWEDKYHRQPINTNNIKELLEEALRQQELPLFFEAYPYVKDLLNMNHFFGKQNKSIEDFSNFYSIVNSYLVCFEKYEAVMPLLILREHIKLMLNRDDFDKEFYKAHMKGAEAVMREKRTGDQSTGVAFLSLFIERDIPYKMRNFPGYQKFNWESLEGLSKELYRSDSKFDYEKLNNLILSLENYIDNLILFQLGHIEEKDINEVKAPISFEITHAKLNLNPAFNIINHYFTILEQVKEDTKITRLATLRVITALGEALNVIKILLPEENRINLEVTINLRDHILHASTAHSYLEDLISNDNNKTLVDIIKELLEVKGYLPELEKHLKSSQDGSKELAKIVLPKLVEFEKAFAEARKIDDRDEKLTVAEKQTLLSLIPTTNRVPNPNYDQIEGFINLSKQMDRNTFSSFCPNIDRTTLRKLHERIIEVKKIIGTRKALEEGNLDFTKLNFNINKAEKEKLKIIQQQKNSKELNDFLDKYEAKIKFEGGEKEDFLNKVKEIDITSSIQVLKNIIEHPERLPKKEEFLKLQDIVFIDNTEAKKYWELAYKKVATGHICYLKRYQIIQVTHLSAALDDLKRITSNIYDGKGIDIQLDPIASIACEMVYGFCLQGFKNISKYSDLLYDYQDQSLYFYAYQHPLEKMKSYMDLSIKMRNQIFHFERVFREPMSIEFCREIWFSVIQDLTHGMFPGVPTQLGEIEKFRDTLKNDLVRDENTLNMYEAEIKQIVQSEKDKEAASSLSTSSTEPNISKKGKEKEGFVDKVNEERKEKDQQKQGRY